VKQFWGYFSSCYLAYGPTARPSNSLKFLLETRLESESFEPLIDFLAFLVQKL